MKVKTKEEIIEELNSPTWSWGSTSYYGVPLIEFNKNQILQIISTFYKDIDCFHWCDTFGRKLMNKEQIIEDIKNNPTFEVEINGTKHCIDKQKFMDWMRQQTIEEVNTAKE